MNIRLHHIDYKRAGRYLLQDISLEIPSGKMTVLIGANGAGKSTLLKLMAGHERPSQGTIKYDQKPISKLSVEQLSKQRAVLSQHLQVAFPISVMETVLLGRYPHPTSQEENRNIARRALQQVGMLDFAYRDIRFLSGGEQQRVHTARALAQVWSDSPKGNILFLDEPTASLDVTYQHQLLGLTKELTKQKGFTVVTVLHDMNLAAQYADQIAVLHKGKLLDFGQPQRILQPSLIEQAFGVRSVIQRHPVYDCPQVVTYC